MYHAQKNSVPIIVWYPWSYKYDIFYLQMKNRGNQQNILLQKV